MATTVEGASQLRQELEREHREFLAARAAAQEALRSDPGPWDAKRLEARIVDRAEVGRRVARAAMAALLVDGDLERRPDRTISRGPELGATGTTNPSGANDQVQEIDPTDDSPSSG